ncbi:MAG: ABC transporter substrate-binding protein [Syntrophobacteraceae bacterium]|jgi:polar amino acid transport system substrate-binding protein
MKNFVKNEILIPIYVILSAVLIMTSPAIAKDLTASVALLPNISESPEKGVFIDLIKAMNEVYPDGKFKIEVFPFGRSIDNVVTGKADFHIPMLRNPNIPEEKLPFRYASVPMGKVYFVIYSHKDNPITREMIEKAMSQKPFPYKISMMRGLENFAGFPVEAETSIDQMIEKVGKKRIDAFIHAQEESDYVLNQLKLKDIHREFYTSFDDVVLVQKGEKGDEADKIISVSLKTLASSGRLDELHSKIHVPYRDWQPDQMNW